MTAQIQTVTRIVRISTWDGESKIAHQVLAEVTRPARYSDLFERHFDITSDKVVRILECHEWEHRMGGVGEQKPADFSALPKCVQTTLRGIAFSRALNRVYT